MGAGSDMAGGSRAWMVGGAGGSSRTRVGGVLVTGFEPFHRWRVNSSWEGAALLAARRPEIRAARLPVDHAAAAAAVRDALERLRPRALLMCGLAAEPRCRLERIGRDRSGSARAGAWPWERALATVRARGAPARFSDHAGGYVCDTAYAAALAERAETGRPRQVAFLHVPPLGPVWSAARIADAIEAALAPVDRRSAAAQRLRGTRGGRNSIGG